MRMLQSIKSKIIKRLAVPLYYEIQKLSAKNEIHVNNFKKFGHNSSFSGANHRISGYSSIQIGNNVHIGENSFIKGEGGVIIGDNTHISRNFILFSMEHDHQGKLLPFDTNLVFGPVEIGKNVSIGMNVCINAGAKIGDGCIINSGSVVYGSIPPLSIVEAPPAIITNQRDQIHYANLLSQNRYAGSNGKSLQSNEILEKEGDQYQSIRSLSELIEFNGTKAVKKTFIKTDEGKLAFKNEKLAYQKFKKYNWCPELLEESNDALLIQYLPQECRLDRYTGDVDSNLLGEILWCLFDIYNEGFAHGDFHTKNIFVTSSGIKIIDFENLQPIGSGGRFL